MTTYSSRFDSGHTSVYVTVSVRATGFCTFCSLRLVPLNRSLAISAPKLSLDLVVGAAV